MNWVYAAYGAAWVIHIVYFLTLTARYQQVRRDIQDLDHK